MVPVEVVEEAYVETTAVPFEVGLAEAEPSIFVQYDPLYTCISPVEPQSVHQRVKPATGETMAVFCA
jgi:hypothetical protein